MAVTLHYWLVACAVVGSGCILESVLPDDATELLKVRVEAAESTIIVVPVPVTDRTTLDDWVEAFSKSNPTLKAESAATQAGQGIRLEFPSSGTATASLRRGPDRGVAEHYLDAAWTMADDENGRSSSDLGSVTIVLERGAVSGVDIDYRASSQYCGRSDQGHGGPFDPGQHILRLREAGAWCS